MREHELQDTHTKETAIKRIGAPNLRVRYFPVSKIAYKPLVRVRGRPHRVILRRYSKFNYKTSNIIFFCFLRNRWYRDDHEQWRNRGPRVIFFVHIYEWIKFFFFFWERGAGNFLCYAIDHKRKTISRTAMAKTGYVQKFFQRGTCTRSVSAYQPYAKVILIHKFIIIYTAGDGNK